MKIKNAILLSLLFLLIQNRSMAQATSYEKLILKSKIEDGKYTYQNTSTKKQDTSFYLEFNFSYVKHKKFKEGDVEYHYYTGSGVMDGKIDLKDFNKSGKININPKPATLEYDKKNENYIITVTNGNKKVQYVFKMYSFKNLDPADYYEILN